MGLQCLSFAGLSIIDINLLYCKYNEKYFSDDHFSDIVRVLTWRVQKMRSATSSESPRLVRIAVPCAQTRVAIEMHS